MKSCRKDQRGFTLIEVLVAFLILALSMGTLFSLFSGSLRSVRQGEDYAQATAVAQAQLARLDANGMAAHTDELGETESGYRWHVQFAPMPGELPQAADSGFEPVMVTITVSWGALDSRSVEMTTVRLAPQ